jgi:hypothetical protein
MSFSGCSPHHQYSSGPSCLGRQWISSSEKVPLMRGASGHLPRHVALGVFRPLFAAIA